jgi:hypothetical protein
MSQNAAESSLEDLEIKPYLITKLRNAGIESIFDLAVSVPLDLLEYCPEQVAVDLAMRARKALADKGALVKNFILPKISWKEEKIYSNVLRDLQDLIHF